MTGRIKLSALLLGTTALIVAAIVAGRIDRASAAPPGPPTAPVEVVNEPSDPVPVTVENAISVDGFPANQDVTVTGDTSVV